MKLSNASQPTCTSTSGEVHDVFMYVICPDAGKLSSPLNNAIIFVCVYVCICCVFMCVYVRANLYVTSCFSNLFS